MMMSGARRQKPEKMARLRPRDLDSEKERIARTEPGSYRRARENVATLDKDLTNVAVR